MERRPWAAAAVAWAGAACALAGCGDPNADLDGEWHGRGYAAGSDQEFALRLRVKEAKYRDDDFARLTIDGESAYASRLNVSDSQTVRARFHFANGDYVRLNAHTHDEADEMRGWLWLDRNGVVTRVQFKLRGSGDVSYVYAKVKQAEPSPAASEPVAPESEAPAPTVDEPPIAPTESLWPESADAAAEDEERQP